MKTLIQKIIAAAIISFANLTIADSALPLLPTDSNAIQFNDSNKIDTAANYQKIIDEYKKYLNSVPSPVRLEIKQFRMDIAKIQKQKRDLYKKLSVEAQSYLAEEESFRQKLPIMPTEKNEVEKKENNFLSKLPLLGKKSNN